MILNQKYKCELFKRKIVRISYWGLLIRLNSHLIEKNKKESNFLENRGKKRNSKKIFVAHIHRISMNLLLTIHLITQAPNFGDPTNSLKKLEPIHFLP